MQREPMSFFLSSVCARQKHIVVKTNFDGAVIVIDMIPRVNTLASVSAKSSLISTA